MFICLAIPGVLLFTLTSLGLVLKIIDKDFVVFNGFFKEIIVLSLISITSLIMVILGVSKIKQWRYIFVFISIPIVILLNLLIGWLMEGTIFSSFSNIFSITIVVVPFLISNYVRKYYEKIKG